MLTEIEHHWNKLKRLSKLSEEQLNLARINTVSKIIFINEELIPKETWLVSEKITQDIDIDDTDFVALTKHIKGYLWTGDKELYNGLKTKNFHRVLNTRELLDLRDKKEI
jgi:predicted nucleic acid-binding protein